MASRTQDLDKIIGIYSFVIFIDRVISSQISAVCSDNYQVGVLATEHLISKGCRKLAHISGSSYLEFDVNKRYFGFKDVCERMEVSHMVIDATEEQFFSIAGAPRLHLQKTLAEVIFSPVLKYRERRVVF